MPGGSIHDRIKAAEALGGAKSSTSGARSHKLSLKTDEHIKEEFLRRGDGGWHKKVDIGQHEKFMPSLAMPPIIKLTAESPVVTPPLQELPRKLPKEASSAFDSAAEKPLEFKVGPSSDAPREFPGAFVSAPVDNTAESSGHTDKEWSRVEQMEAEQQAAMEAEAAKAGQEHAEWDRVAQMEAEQQAAMDAEAAKAKQHVGGKNKETKRTAKDVPIGRFEDLLDNAATKHSSPRVPSKDHGHSKSRHARVDSDDGSQEILTEEPAGSREQVLFDPVEWRRKKQARQERKASRQHSHGENLTVVDDPEDKPHARNRSVRSPSIRLFRVNDDDGDDHDHHRHKHRSHSRSTRERDPDQNSHSPPHSARRSSPSLWPSFSTSERKSVSDIIDAVPRPRSSHGHRRTFSDDRSIGGHSTNTAATTRSHVSERELEFVEYIAGKKLDHIPLAPPKSPTRPMGFVRSRSHTGEYTEGYTHNKNLLRKPSDDEVIEHFEHDWEKKERRKSHSRHESREHHRDEPWQVRLLQELARR